MVIAECVKVKYETAMSRLISAPFFSAQPVLSRAEYGAAVSRRPNDKIVTAMLTQHFQAGNIRRIARGVFASVPKHATRASGPSTASWPPPVCVVAA
jgi:hypothetical protein